LSVVDIHTPVPSGGELSDASLSPGQSFFDFRHGVAIRVLSAKNGYYTVGVQSSINYLLSLVAPAQVNALTRQTAFIVIDPPAPGLKLKVYLDHSQNTIYNTSTSGSSRYNVSLDFGIGQGGNHIITTYLFNPNGLLAASSSATTTVNVPFWLYFLVPPLSFIVLAIGVVAILLFSLLPKRGKRETPTG
jgi:hypothetical protein